MTRTVDAQADALLVAALRDSGGDLLAAFSVLCLSVTLTDLAGETFEQAIGRAVGDLYRRPSIVVVARRPAPQD